MNKKTPEEVAKYYIQKRKLEGRGIPVTYRTAEEKTKTPVILKAARTKEVTAKLFVNY